MPSSSKNLGVVTAALACLFSCSEAHPAEPGARDSGVVARDASAGLADAPAPELDARAEVDASACPADCAVPSGSVPLDDLAIAERLARFLWNAPPDAELSSTPLREPEQIEAQARRMLAELAARDGVRAWMHAWLPPARVDPSTDPLNAALVEETDRFAEHVVLERDGRLETLFTASFTFLDARLAAHYGVPAPATDWTLVELPPEHRAGLLTHGSMLVAPRDDPVTRGAFIRTFALCQPVPPPPPGVDLTPPAPSDSMTRRQAYEAAITDAVCAACHRLTDPIGFGFEHYDDLGRWRDTDRGLPIDDSGEIVSGDDATGAFSGPRELAVRLARSEIVGRCAAKETFEHALGRASAPSDECSIDAAYCVFVAAGGDLRELAVAVARSSPFRYP